MDREKLMKGIHISLVFFFVFIFGYLPAIEPLTEISMKVLGVFIGTIYGWVTVDLGWPSLIGVAGLAFTGIMPAEQVLAQAFGSQLIVMLFVMFMFAAFFQQAGLTTVIVDYLLTRKFSQGKPYLIFFNFMLAGFLASCLSNCVAIFVIFLEIFRGIIKKTGLKPYSPAMPAFLAGMCVNIVISEAAVPFKTTAIVAITTYKTFSGVDIDFFTYTLFVFPISIFVIAAYTLICKYIMRVDLSPLKVYRHTVESGKIATPRQLMILFALFICLLLITCISVLPDSWTIGRQLKSLGLGGFSILILGVLLLISYGNKYLVDIEEAAQYFPWKIFLSMVALFPLATCLSSDQLVFRRLLIDWSTYAISHVYPWMVIYAIVLLPCLLTQLANNVVVCAIFSGLVASLGATLPYPPVLLTCLVALGSSLAMFFPAANGLNTIAFTQLDLIHFGQEISFGFITAMILAVLITIVGYLYGMIIFG